MNKTIKSKKPEEFNLSVADKFLINKDGTFKKKRFMEQELGGGIRILYSYRLFRSIYDEDNYLVHQVFISFMREHDIIASIWSNLSCGDPNIADTVYSYDNFILSEEKFLQKIESEPQIFEWCLWNV